MLKSALVSLSKAQWAQKLVTQWGPGKRTARRFVAGETLPQAIEVANRLNRRGLLVSLDHLGENTTSAEEAAQATKEILSSLDAIQNSQVSANVSIKLSQIGLALDPELCSGNLVKILLHAREQSNFVRIDMEDSPFTQATLDLYCWVRQAGFDNVGIVLQSSLYRSEADFMTLQPLRPRIRLVKGAYLEPAAVAYPRKKDVDASFDRLASAMLSAASDADPDGHSVGGRVPPLVAIATHDPQRIEYARQAALRSGLSQGSIEFQMLYGIRRDLQEHLIHEGYPVRVYVPYGTHWYPYLMRRLAERPTNIWFFIRNLLRS